MTLRTELVRNHGELSDACKARWNELASNPFQRWEWLGSWMEAFETQYSMAALKVLDGDRIRGFAPLCIDQRLTSGRTLMFMGAGKACTDHLSILTEDGHATEVCEAIADWLIDEAPNNCAWDHLELIGVDLHDLAVDLLVTALEKRGVRTDVSDGLGCYAIDLPSTWDDYVKMRSKSGRREIRQSARNIDDGLIQVKTIESADELNRYWGDFVDLHQRRRTDSGTDNCFEHPHFESFLRTAATRLLDAGLLRFIVALAEDQPVGVQFSVADHSAWHFYQSGMDPEASSLRPGLSVFCHTIRESIEAGLSQFDMMRGDEPYKLRWRATLRPTQEVRAFSPRLASQVRGGVVKAGSALKQFLSLGQAWVPGGSVSNSNC